MYCCSQSLQLCLTLCNPMDWSLPGSSVHGILQARILEWVPFPSPMHKSEKWKWSRSVVSDSVRSHRRQSTRLPRPWDPPGKNTGVGAISFSNVWKWKVKVKSLSCVRIVATSWTAAYQTPPSMGFSRQEYWSQVPLPSPTCTPRVVLN